eukprot:14145603-Alexandrium_andersonii.AAC.1
MYSISAPRSPDPGSSACVYLLPRAPQAPRSAQRVCGALCRSPAPPIRKNLEAIAAAGASRPRNSRKL